MGPIWGSSPGRSACQPGRGNDRHGRGLADAFSVGCLGKYGREGVQWWLCYSLYPAGTIILARALTHERLTKAGMFGLCLAAASVSLIAAGAVR